MALPWGAFLFCTCACSLLQLGPVEASEAGGLDWDCEEDAEEHTAPEELSEAQGLEDNDVIPARPPGADSDKAKTIKPSKITTTSAAKTTTRKPMTSQIQNKPPPGLSSTPNAKNALTPGPPGQSDKKCVLPFKYGNKKHFDCTVEGSMFHWCSLTDEYSGKWKYCTDDDRARCVFPFIFEGRVYKDCITKGSLFRMAWCSLSPNYDQDHAWKYCY